ncbi:MAG TPA: AtpZ/AtpI family protein [Acidimicrobiales bacterium]|jgi:F0F1-type ATP synthase assembly protein I|nr:AtpZ/AtpI family protein [Acidimicrobiales bacterium]
MAEHSSNSAPDPGQPTPDKRAPSFGDLFWLGTGCAISVIAGGAIGYGLDTAFGTTPWITFGGLAFGVVSAVLLAVAQVRKFL